MIEPLYRVKIMEELSRIESEEGVRILYACESGSRAWGFPSKDSDYDVRFIYIRSVDWYLSIVEKRDVIERPISDMLDINGWDLRKALYLFRKSNPPLLEWLQSPLAYAERLSTAENIRALSSLIFSPRSCMYHYLNMAKGNYRDYLQGEQVKAKKYFYVLRPILACSWIEKYNTMPPIVFEELVNDSIPPDSELYSAIQLLLERKRAGDELQLEPRLSLINDFLEERMAYYEKTAPLMSPSTGPLTQQLDELFLAALREAWEESFSALV